ncbi:MAG: peptidase T [Lachnospiraceae bacterium]|nr:peptidase T [Lachnospiraceae bacterium]
MNVIDRFLKYVSFDTTSDEDSESTPSTAKQKLLGEYLTRELKELGLEDAHMDENGYVYAFLPASLGREEEAAIGLIAHMDTSPAVSGTDIKPRRVVYEGGELPLNDTVSLKLAVFPFLEKYIGQELIVTDGTTLLGADDKAGIAEIVTAMEYLLAHPEIPHGPLAVGFTPDEEVGRGADHFDVAKFACDFAYTVDGGALGELEYENFNAASAKILIHGVNIHPGSAKNKMKNALLIGAELIQMLPEAETPGHTEGYEGFYHVGEMSGNETLLQLKMIIRDHDRASFEARKAFLLRLVQYLNEKYGAGTLELELKDSYYNMKEKILPVMHVIERAEKAMKAAGVSPITVPIRGGTDGARLSYMGLPCPNLSTGGENFHGVHEFVSVPAMEKMVEILINLLRCEA